MFGMFGINVTLLRYIGIFLFFCSTLYPDLQLFRTLRTVDFELLLNDKELIDLACCKVYSTTKLFGVME